MLRAALRYGERHLRPLALGEPTLQKFRLLDGKRQQDLARYERRAMVVLLQECRKKRLIRLLLTAREQEVLTPDHLARAYKKDHDDRPQPRSRHADGILVARSRHDVLLLRHLAHGGELIAQTRRPLEVVILRRLRHAARKLLFYLLRPTFEEQAYLVDHRAVLLLVNRLAARRKTALDVILQARTFDLHILACAQREESLQELHALVHRACRRIGAEVARAVFRDAPRDHDARILVGQRNLEVWIALVILEADVVARAVLLDEVALQDQCLDLRMCENRLEVGNLRDHSSHLRRLVLAALKVLPHAVLEDDGLADVDDAPLRVLHDVNAGRIRQQLELLFHDFRHLLPLAFHVRCSMLDAILFAAGNSCRGKGLWTLCAALT